MVLESLQLLVQKFFLCVFIPSQSLLVSFIVLEESFAINLLDRIHKVASEIGECGTRIDDLLVMNLSLATLVSFVAKPARGGS